MISGWNISCYSKWLNRNCVFLVMQTTLSSCQVFKGRTLILNLTVTHLHAELVQSWTKYSYPHRFKLHSESFEPRAEVQGILCSHWSLASYSITKPFLFKWIPVLQTLTNSKQKHMAVSKPLLHKCYLFYSFKNNQHSESCLFQGLYA